MNSWLVTPMGLVDVTSRYMLLIDGRIARLVEEGEVMLDGAWGSASNRASAKQTIGHKRESLRNIARS